MEMCRCDTFTTFQLAMNIFFRVSRICEILFPFLSGSITIVSYGTAFWYVEEESGSHVGLWQKCVGNPLRCVGITLEYSGTNGEFCCCCLLNLFKTIQMCILLIPNSDQ